MTTEATKLKAPAATAIAAPPTTLSITRIAVEKAKKGLRPSAGCHVGEHAYAVVVPGEQEQVGPISRYLLVIVPDPVDRKAVLEVLRPAFDQSDERHDPEEVERRRSRKDVHGGERN
jgi:hypothetical protein